ncbi:MAG: ammonia channel protein, partial [Comamonadaceae bacterium]|nr:ammonia channel protein [Comamonadaceae bacterium]
DASMQLGWQLLADLPRSELTRLSDAQIAAHLGGAAAAALTAAGAAAAGAPAAAVAAADAPAGPAR